MTTVAEDLRNSIQAAYDERQRLLFEAERLNKRIVQLQAEHAVAANPPTWKNTLRNDGRVSGDGFNRMARELGYKYTLWNDRIYHTDIEADSSDTGLTIEFLERK